MEWVVMGKNDQQREQRNNSSVLFKELHVQMEMERKDTGNFVNLEASP